jgi:hypothetical protein
MVCEKHGTWIDFDYCAFCALEDKYEEREALLSALLEKAEIAWGLAINLYPDLESISPFDS